MHTMSLETLENMPLADIKWYLDRMDMQQKIEKEQIDNAKSSNGNSQT